MQPILPPPGEADAARLNRGDHPGADWLPGECDVSIRPVGFLPCDGSWQSQIPGKPVGFYFKSVGRGAALLLNNPLDQRGQIHETDVHAPREFRQLLDRIFANNLALRAIASACNTRGGDADFAPQKALDERADTFRTTDDSVTNAEMILDFQNPVTFSVVTRFEFPPSGQGVESFVLDQWQDGKWVELSAGTSIGNCRLLRLQPVTTNRVRLRILQSAAAPAIEEVQLLQQQRQIARLRCWEKSLNLAA